MSLIKLWNEDETAKIEEKNKETEQLLTSQDLLMEVSRVRDKCLSFLAFLNERIPRISERTDQIERNLNRESENEEDEDK